MSKKLIYTFFIICTIVSCRSGKEKLKQDRVYTQNTRATEASVWQQKFTQDSTQRYWTLITDSIFFFHPDSGLWARGGLMYVEDRYGLHTYQNTGISHSDSTVSTRDQSNTKKITWSKQSLWPLLFVVTVIIAFVIFIFIRKVL